jgi:hypothetical protein
MRGVPKQSDGNIARPVHEGIDIRPDRSGDGADVVRGRSERRSRREPRERRERKEKD